MHRTVDAALTRWFGTTQLSYRAVAALLAPVVVSQVFVIGFSVLNPLLAAPVGIDAISAVSTVEYLNVFLLSVFIALATAGSVLVAQHAGRRDGDQVRGAAGGTLWAVVLPAVAIGGALLLAQGPLLGALLGRAGGRVEAYAAVYLAGSALSYPAYAIVEASSASLRGVARTRPALYLTVAMNGGYLLIAAGLTRGAHLGVTGLAIALVISRYTAAVFALWLLHREPLLGVGRRTAWAFDRAMVRRVAVVGLPFVAEQLFFNGGKLLTQAFVVGLGTLQITANAVATSLIGLSEIVPQAMCIALVPIVGQAVGDGRLDDARRIIRSFLWSSTVVSVAAAVAMLVGFRSLVALYHTPPAAVGDVTAIFVMATAARLLGLWGLSYLLPSGLRAAGDAAFTTAVATVTMIVRVALIWVVGIRLGHGVVGVWAVMVAEWAARSAIFAARLRGGGWEHRSLVRVPEPAGPGADDG